MPPQQGPIAKRALADAQTADVLSIKEAGGNNRGTWVEAILRTVHLAAGNPWCLAFVETRLIKAAAALGLPLPKDFPLTGYTPTFAAWARSKGWFTPTAFAMKETYRVQPGDLVFFYGLVEGVFRIRHVGIVTEVHPWGVMTVEGNTGPDGGRDGDGVYRKQRAWRALGNPDKSGFVRLPF